MKKKSFLLLSLMLSVIFVVASGATFITNAEALNGNSYQQIYTDKIDNEVELTETDTYSPVNGKNYTFTSTYKPGVFNTRVTAHFSTNSVYGNIYVKAHIDCFLNQFYDEKPFEKGQTSGKATTAPSRLRPLPREFYFQYRLTDGTSLKKDYTRTYHYDGIY